MTKDHKHKFAAVILAAGKGERMKSVLPKVLHKLADKPLVGHVLHTVKELSPEKVVVVVAPGMDSVRDTVLKSAPSALFAVQEQQKGTGHAVRAALPELKDFKGTVLVLYGDTPLITAESLRELLAQKAEHQATIALLGMQPKNPMGYGRLVMGTKPWVDVIVECKDATPEEKKISWVWGGIMAFDADFLKEELPGLAPSPVTNEYYLTKLIEVAASRRLRTLMVPMTEEEAMGVNSRVQLAEAEKSLQQRLRLRAMEQGATLVDPSSVTFSTDTKLGTDVVVHPHVVFGPGVTVGSATEIRSFSHIEGAEIGKNAVIGPFARVRPGSRIGDKAHVGNFVELKKTTLGEGAKANHLSYVGDSQVGEGANIGAGTITCNYDGTNKYDTVIGANAFIGSNTSLVAPVTIGEGAIVGAGSVITEDVEADALAIARAPQVNKPAKAKEIKRRKRKTG
jgi:bifunctional UDP-N-acetylglucosamine pyrophosphorylase/glucosamine-1-phosphate N-acetyltransferase